MLTRVAREKALPFELLVPNAETIEAMKEARRGKLNSFDDRILITGGGGSFPSGGAPTAPSTIVFLPPGAGREFQPE